MEPKSQILRYRIRLFLAYLRCPGLFGMITHLRPFLVAASRKKRVLRHLNVPAVLSFLLVLPAAAEAENLNQKIADAARKSTGKKMWYGYGLRTGFLGCSAAVCNVLESAGIKRAHSAAVSIMRNQLLRSPPSCEEFILKDGTDSDINDEVLLKFSKPGDILVAFVESPSKPNLGGNAHCGIMGDTTTVYTNDWNDGIWKEVNIHRMFDYYSHVRLLRLSSTRQTRSTTELRKKPATTNLQSQQKH